MEHAERIVAQPTGSNRWGFGTMQLSVSTGTPVMPGVRFRQMIHSDFERFFSLVRFFIG
jgi:hypothetical protein